VSLTADIWSWFTTASNWTGANGIIHRTWQHIQYSFWASLVAIAVALPLGLLLGHTRKLPFLAVNIAGLARALPTLGLVILVSLRWPLRLWPVLFVLAILALPSILANTYTGVAGVEHDVGDAAQGMGMTGAQVLARVELPLATPLIMTGLRSGVNQVIATATIVAYPGLGGLGRFIIDGLASTDYAELAGGAVLVVALALVVEGLFALLQRAVTPAGMRVRGRPESVTLRPSRQAVEGFPPAEA
jgi:osmoprotectant transport system permease protein